MKHDSLTMMPLTKKRIVVRLITKYVSVTDVTDVIDVTITRRDRCDSSNSFLALEFPIVS